MTGIEAGVPFSVPAAETPELDTKALLQNSNLLTRHTLDTDVLIIGGGMSGVCAALVYERSRSLLAPMLTHVVYNACAIVAQAMLR